MIWPREAWFEPVERFREKLGTMGEGVTVGIWDSGYSNMRDTGRTDAQGKKLYEGAPDIFGGRMKGRSYVDADHSRYDAPTGSMHGSEIARIIGGDVDYWGIAPACDLITIKGVVPDSRYSFASLVQDKQVYAKVDVLNISHAFDQDSQTPSVTSIIGEFTNNVADDKLIVASVGNFSARNGPKVTFPASIASVVSVGATVGWTLKAFRLSAPSTNLDLCVPGVDLNSFYYGKPISGTSFSAAIVSGLMCLLISFRKREGLTHTALTLRALFMQAAIPGPDRDRFGDGLLDLDRLVQLAHTTPSTP